MALISINPATGKVIKTFDELPLEEVKEQIGKAQNAFQVWRKTSFRQRRAIVKRVGSLLRKNRDKYSGLITEEVGKPIRESEGEIEKCAWLCEYYAQHGERFLKREVVSTDASRSYVTFEPIGIIFAIMPWNFPFWQVFRCAISAFMGGNVVLLKHSSNVSMSALQIERIFEKAGFPIDTFKTLLIGSKRARTVIEDERVGAVTFTGSKTGGMEVAETAGKKLKKVVLELGGSDPFIVLKDADLSRCSAMAVAARTINSGQSCIAAKRFIVVQDVAVEFERLLVQGMKQLKMGDPRNSETQIGPLAREDVLNNLHRQIQDSVSRGATVLLGGKRLEGRGYYYPPTVLTDVKKGMPVFDEETFGPAAAVVKVKDEEEAVRVANDSSFGLGASIWTRDRFKAEAFAHRIESGCVFVNSLVKSDPRLPFGGIKQSGYGRELSHYGIREFVNVKTIWVE